MFAIGRLFNVLERGNASYDRVIQILKEKRILLNHLMLENNQPKEPFR